MKVLTQGKTRHALEVITQRTDVTGNTKLFYLLTILTLESLIELG